MDFKVGGQFRIQLTGPDGPGPFVVGEYLRIEPHSCIEYTNGFVLEGAEQMRVTCAFEDRGETSLLRMTSLFASVAMNDQHSKMRFKERVASGHAQLDALLEELK